jgi:hypothetical protein
VTTPDKRPAVFPWSLVHKWRWSVVLNVAGVAVALGVYAVGIYLLWGVVREPLFLKCVAVAVALGVYAVGIYLLWGAVYTWGWSLFLKCVAVAVALGVCAVGILLLWGVWDGTPVAATFTRVGGATRVETALEASRFWLIPPQKVVETQTDSSQVMLEAAQCAMAWNAPLLFTSPDPKRQRRVDATVNDWRKIEKRKDLARPEMITIKSQHGPWRETALPAVITITSQHKACHGIKSRDPAGVAGLSTLEVPNQLIQLPPGRTGQTLASVVVFAAAIQPGHLPDVAIGLALAAHMARANREKVSLVVVPHYLESDPELEKKLQSQHEPVTSGVVLGQTPTVPEDTRALLRQLLTSRDRHGVLGQLQDNLGSVGSLIATLLALAGLAAATRITALIVIEPLERKEQIKREERQLGRESVPFATITSNQAKKTWKFVRSKLSPGGVTPMPVEKSDWLAGLHDKREVTVWLRSGRQVTGTIESQIPDTRDATVFRIKNVHPVPSGPKGTHVLVSVKDIEMIEFNYSESGDSQGS